MMSLEIMLESSPDENCNHDYNFWTQEGSKQFYYCWKCQHAIAIVILPGEVIAEGESRQLSGDGQTPLPSAENSSGVHESIADDDGSKSL